MIYLIAYLIIGLMFFSSFNKGSGMHRDPMQLFLILLLLALIVGMGDMLGGYDRYIYGELFDRTSDYVSAGVSVFNEDNPIMGYSSEIGYVIWNSVVAHCTENRYIYILVTTLFMFIFIFFSLRDYIEGDYLFAVLVFMGMWYFFSFTYMRQAMATCIAWFSFRYVIRRQLIPFLICTYIAYKFHNSAIVFLPLYFLPRKKWSKKEIIMCMGVLFIIGVTGMTSALYAIYGGSDEDSRNNGYDMDDTGGRFIYLVEVVIYLWLIFKKYDKIGNNTKDLVFLNASLLFCGMLLFFFRSSNAGRQSWYFVIGFIYLFTKLATYRIPAKERNYSYWVLSIMFGLYLRIVIAWGSLISPYKTFLTDGYREQDIIIKVFEYDWNYEKDKMYRKPFRLVYDNWG